MLLGGSYFGNPVSRSVSVQRLTVRATGCLAWGAVDRQKRRRRAARVPAAQPESLGPGRARKGRAGERRRLLPAPEEAETPLHEAAEAGGLAAPSPGRADSGSLAGSLPRSLARSRLGARSARPVGRTGGSGRAPSPDARAALRGGRARGLRPPPGPGRAPRAPEAPTDLREQRLPPSPAPLRPQRRRGRRRLHLRGRLGRTVLPPRVSAWPGEPPSAAGPRPRGHAQSGLLALGPAPIGLGHARLSALSPAPTGIGHASWLPARPRSNHRPRLLLGPRPNRVRPRLLEPSPAPDRIRTRLVAPGPAPTGFDHFSWSPAPTVLGHASPSLAQLPTTLDHASWRPVPPRSDQATPLSVLSPAPCGSLAARAPPAGHGTCIGAVLLQPFSPCVL